MKKSLIALAFGTLGLGIAEFVMMAILPYVAADLHISIPTAGHLISAYALGVCAGAPMLTLARKLPLKNILLGLVAIMMVGNIFASLSPNYWTMLVARFISGLPHGAYFGVASVVAEKLADKGKGSEAVSIMIAGMTIANLFGVPLGTSLSTLLSWRLTFMLVGVWGIIILYYIWKWVPQVEGLPDTGFKGQFRFLKTGAPWLILGATMLGNGGVFCWYSYINPLLTKVSGFSTESITLLMVLAGFGMVVGNLLGGKLSDKYTPGRVAASTQFILFTALLGIFFVAHINWAHSPAHVPLYSRAIRCVESSTNLYHSLCQRRRVTGSSLYTSGFQSRQCHRRIYRRSTPASRTRISISRPDRSTPRLRRVYPPHAVLQKIRAEESVIFNRRICKIQ